MYNCFTIPLVLAFQPEEANSLEWDLSNWIITCIFAIDILINFRTTYFSEGEEIEAGLRLFLNYLFSFRFILDLITTIPFDLIAKLMGTYSIDIQKALSATRMLKFIRVGGITNLIASLRFEKSTKTLIKILQLLLYMVLFVHIQGCLFFFCVRYYSSLLNISRLI